MMMVRVYLAEDDRTTCAEVQAVIDGRSDAHDFVAVTDDGAEITVRFQRSEDIDAVRA